MKPPKQCVCEKPKPTEAAEETLDKGGVWTGIEYTACESCGHALDEPRAIELDITDPATLDSPP